MDRRAKRLICLLCALLLIQPVYYICLAHQHSEIKKTQQGTLDAMVEQQQEIDELSGEVYNLQLLRQTEEKNASRGAYDRTGTCLGEFDITYYCGCEKCCGKTDKITKLGTTATAGRTVGADWNVLPPGTKIDIEGIGERVVEDTGGGLQGNHIDVYVDSHEEALVLGRATRKVYEVKQ